LGGNFSKGYANGSAVGTLIGRTTGLLMLDKLPEVKLASAANVLQAFTKKSASIAQPMILMLTCDQERDDVFGAVDK